VKSFRFIRAPWTPLYGGREYDLPVFFIEGRDLIGKGSKEEGSVLGKGSPQKIE